MPPPTSSESADQLQAATTAGGGDIDELCQLVIGLDRTRLLGLLQRLEDHGQFSEHMSRALSAAIRLALVRDPSFAKALAPLISQGVHGTVQRDAAAFGQLLAPAMGPAIRKSVWLMLRGLVESLERTFEQRFSARSLKWRWESWRTGRSFAEVVFLHTLVFRVEHVFLVHRETGVLLQHASPPDIPARQPELISAMLTAIQDFVSDAFEAPEGETLGAFQVGQLEVQVESGKHAVLATVVRGVATQAIRLRLREALERIQMALSVPLTEFDGETDVFELAQPELESCLLQQQLEGRAPLRTKKKKRVGRGRWVMAAVGVALLAWIVVAWIQRSSESSRVATFLAELRQEPGVVVTHAARSNGHWSVEGLRDRLAADPVELAARHDVEDLVTVAFADHQSLHPPFVLERLLRALEPPASAIVDLEGGRLSVRGRAPHAFFERCRLAVAMTPGVTTLDTSGLQDDDATAWRDTIAALAAARVPLTRPAAAGTEGLGEVLELARELIVYGDALGRRVALECQVLLPPDADPTPTRAIAVDYAAHLARELAIPVRLGVVRRDLGVVQPMLRCEASESR